ncbi:hypothetical protein [Endozoicomonas atrinae]|uniref:hypothetical protein n=1 Tax=Endozoicomonas atrinae TaxID=1333660 RepID=UPI00082401B5|nr:hypothetical protein [Endozoicomonas atrinae]
MNKLSELFLDLYMVTITFLGCLLISIALPLMIAFNFEFVADMAIKSWFHTIGVTMFFGVIPVAVFMVFTLPKDIVVIFKKIKASCTEGRTSA